MTQEEKAKRYDEAIEIARKINSGEGVVAPKDWTIPEVIFHELRESEDESEDESIRKRIIHALHGDVLDMEETNKAIAWLEKQEHAIGCSEEQMKVLNEILNFAANHENPYWNYYIFETLNNFIRQLKTPCNVYIAGNNDNDKDEKIRKALINIFATHKDYEIFFGVSVEDILAWIEKQGNQKVTIDFKAKDWYVNKVDNKIHNIYGSGKSALEAIKEEKIDNANKVELKFNIGDWVIITTEKDEHTVEVTDISYFRDCYPMYITSEGRWFGNGTKARLWNINCVKDGDILCYDDEVFIYKNFDNSIGYYVCWDGKNIHLNSFYLITLEEMKTIKPATKEQRKELLRHLSNAGYVFDIINKEIIPKND